MKDIKEWKVAYIEVSFLKILEFQKNSRSFEKIFTITIGTIIWNE